MKTLFGVVLCLLICVALTGCLEQAGSSGGGGGIVTALAGGGAGSGGSSIPAGLPHNPEPATLALLGGGLAAYAFLRNRRNKK
jgi:hypothetical protein